MLLHIVYYSSIVFFYFHCFENPTVSLKRCQLRVDESDGNYAECINYRRCGKLCKLRILFCLLQAHVTVNCLREPVSKLYHEKNGKSSVFFNLARCSFGRD